MDNTEDIIHIEQDEDEYTQEAFTPIFHVAPDEAPEQVQTPVPTADEQKSTVESVLKKLGVKAKEIAESEPIPLTPELEQRVNKTSLMAARIFSSVSMWGWSIFGIEYQIVAPDVAQSQKMIEPVMRIAARHSKFIGNVSPDVDDVVEAGTAMSDYALYAMATMQQIREDKLANNGRYTGTRAYRPTTGEVGFNGNGSRPNDLFRPTATSDEPLENTGDAEYTNTQEHLSADQQYNRDMLRQLSIRDLESRVKRSGRL